MKKEVASGVNQLLSDEVKFISDIRSIVSTAKAKTFQAADFFHVACNWLLGKRIVEQEQKGKKRAEYGKRIIELASEALSTTFGRGYGITQIKNYKKFYLLFPYLPIESLTKPYIPEKGQTPSDLLKNGLFFPNLSWSHFERLIRIDNKEERDWYMNEAIAEGWSVRTLSRNIGSQFYHRLLQTPTSQRGIVIDEMKLLTAEYQHNRHYFMCNPVVAEFLGLTPDSAYTESNLETAIINHLQKFILELGKGYAFVARQQRIKTDMGEYFIDLVFYNYILKCFLLIDLKTSQITYEDIGQMDMYIRMYDDLKCTEGDNPTIGLVLCSETSKDLARYSILKDSKQIYAAKYLTYLPTQEELAAEIQRQKEIFTLQSGKER